MNWIQKIAQFKPMALPTDVPVGKRKEHTGIDLIDKMMSPETSNVLQQQYPESGYGGAGAFGYVLKPRPGEMVKVTFDTEEVERASYCFDQKPKYIVPILSMPQKVQEYPELYTIHMKELRPLNIQEIMLLDFLLEYYGAHNKKKLRLDAVMEEFVTSLDVDEILSIYNQIYPLLEWNSTAFNLKDLHGDNFGFDGKQLKILDIGE